MKQISAKVWEQRDFKNYDDDLELNIRNIKMALRKLQILSREGMEDELDIEETIQKHPKTLYYWMSKCVISSKSG